MRVTKVTANLRYSAEAKGAWRSIELGAEASLTSSAEDWEAAQADLYHRLGQQLRTFWSNGNAKADIPEPSVEPTQPVKEHWCNAHQTEWIRQSKGGSIWYSHRTDNGWCNEPKAA